MKFIMVHGFNPKGKELVQQGKRLQNDRDWIPWLKEKLKDKGYEAHNPSMPKFWEPSYEEWKAKIEEYEIDESTVLIGHSLGAAFLLRYLGDKKLKIKKLILVSPSLVSKENFPAVAKFYDFEIDKGIAERTNEIVIYTSDNDYQRMIESAKIAHDKIGGRLIELKGQGHFIEKHMGKSEFPELLDEALP